MKKKNILLITVIILVILLIIGAFLFFNKSETVENDNKTFASEYSLVGEDNIFVYRSAEEIINILEHGTLERNQYFIPKFYLYKILFFF